MLTTSGAPSGVVRAAYTPPLLNKSADCVRHIRNVQQLHEGAWRQTSDSEGSKADDGGGPKFQTLDWAIFWRFATSVLSPQILGISPPGRLTCVSRIWEDFCPPAQLLPPLAAVNF